MLTMSKGFKNYSRDEITIGLLAMSIVIVHILLFVLTQ